MSCVICGDPRYHFESYACLRCRAILNRVDTRGGPGGRRPRNVDTRKRALRRAWDTAGRCFRCHYTGVPLITEPGLRRHPRYLSYEHQTPGDETDLVIVSALVNRMKTDLTDAEFRTMVIALANHFQGRPFDSAAFPERPFERPLESADPTERGPQLNLLPDPPHPAPPNP